MGRDTEEPRVVEGAAVEQGRARESVAGKRKKRKHEQATDPYAAQESRSERNSGKKSKSRVDGLLPDASRDGAEDDGRGELGEARDRGVDDRGKNKKLVPPMDSNSPVSESSRSRKKEETGLLANADVIDAGSSALRGEGNLNSVETSAKKDKKNKKKEKKKEEEEMLARPIDLNSPVSKLSRSKRKKKEGRQENTDAIGAGSSALRGGENNLNSVETGAKKKKEEEKEKKKKKKKVRFSDHNVVYNISESVEHVGEEVELVVGKRYSEEEDQIIMNAIAQFLKDRGLGEDDTHMLFNVKEHPQVRGCWNEIQAAIPWRPRSSLYVHVSLLLYKSQKRSWTVEEIELLKRYRKEHGKGCRWQGLSEHLGRHRHHIKDAWRRNRLVNVNKGRWSLEEYQQLFNLVNLDMRMKSFVKEKTRNKMLKQNISWTAISDKLSTRDHVVCCAKWYNQLASPMVAKGLWKDTDDYFLLDALSELDASCMEDVDWDSLVGNRSGEVCRQRWKEMTKHIGGKKERSFVEQVEILSSRYCSDMIEYMTGGAETQ